MVKELYLNGKSVTSLINFVFAIQCIVKYYRVRYEVYDVYIPLFRKDWKNQQARQ